MAESLKLTKPIKIFGANEDRELTELPYDFENMSARDKLNAGKRMRVAGYVPTVEEIDADYQLYLFTEAVHAADKTIDPDTVLGISARDSQRASSLARSFFFLDLAE